MKKYDKPEIEITEIFRSDVFTQSGGDGNFNLEEEPFN